MISPRTLDTLMSSSSSSSTGDRPIDFTDCILPGAALPVPHARYASPLMVPQREHPLLIHMEGSDATGLTTIIKGVAEYNARCPRFRAKTVLEPLHDIVCSPVGDMRSRQTLSLHETLATQVVCMAGYFAQRRSLLNLQGVDVIIQERSIASLRHVYHAHMSAKGELDPMESLALSALHDSMKPALRVPDLIIHVSSPLEDRLRRLESRNMHRDVLIDRNLLIQIDRHYENYLHACMASDNGPLVVRMMNDDDSQTATTEAFQYILETAFHGLATTHN